MQKRILIAEDESVMRRLLKMYLTREGYLVDEAVNGTETLRKALSLDYDLILLDIFMPEKNGLSVLEELRVERRTPVFLLSAIGGEEEQREGIKMGADDYIIKPFSPAELMTRVKSYFDKQN
ncbi:response regulator transcription factor [Bacillus massilinigeriensis]|uniref:response regulator transcription factor n=1 Tax=Bacillus mediterraneensis TaxID=1805474 RepID=UPI0008F85410|nr:response regulator [Bacillus mediterraneensis]